MENKSIEKLVQELNTESGNAGSPTFEAKRMEIFARCIEDLRKTIDEHGKTATRLGRALNWLTAVIAAATIIGTGVAIWTALRGG